MSQTSIDDVLLLDASNDFDGPTAATAELNINVEHALEPLCPGHGWRDQPSPAMVRSEDAMESAYG